MKLEMNVNGRPVSMDVSPLKRLLDILREDLGLTGSKEGCGEGECGACSVLMNGKLANSCLIPAAQCSGAEIVTVEGVSATPRGKMISECFAETHAVQCGFCTPGMLMAAEAVLSVNPAPDEETVREGLSGNLCRCTGYDMIIDGILLAAEKGKGLW